MDETQRHHRGMHARGVLHACGVEIGADFHRLSSGCVECLLSRARHDKYREPKNANGSRARYYHAKLQREAQWTD